MAEQLNIWEMIYPKKIIEKPIKLIELFSGIGSQLKAMRLLSDQVTPYKTCEWEYTAIISYNAMHIKDHTNYAQGLSKEQLVDKLSGLSTDGKNPLTTTKLQSKSIKFLQGAYNSVIATHNLIDITKAKGDQFEINDVDQYEYIMTYSFPCQDLSKAGKGKGMAKGTNTRSGLLWQVERILDELKSTSNLPQILLMENVPDVIGTNNIAHFKDWEYKLSQLGYTNYIDVLNAKDFGIPQNRERCFMVSILGEYAYSFPRKIDATKKLADLLEKQVDNKYYLSSKMFNYFTQNNQRQKDRGNGFRFEPVNDLEKEIANAITTKAGQRLTDNYIDETEFAWKRQFRPLDETAETSFTITTREGQCAEATYIKDSKNNKVMRVGGLYDKPGKRHQIGSIFNKDGLSPTLDTAAGGNRQPYIVEELPTKVLCAKEPNLKSIMASHLIQEGKVHENDVIRHSYTNSRMKDGKIAAGNNMSPTLDTRADCFGVVVKEEKEPSRLAIRKLTPKNAYA